jgi:hypothetical protein
MAPPFAPPATPQTGNAFIGTQLGPSFAVGPQPCTGLQFADVFITSAQLLAILATPITLVSAPGVGFFLKPEKVVLRFIGGGVAYTDVGGAISLTLGSQAVALASNAIVLVTVSPNRRIQVVDFYAAAAGTGITGTAANPPTEDNAPLQLTKITNTLAAGTGTMHVTTYFTTEPTT